MRDILGHPSDVRQVAAKAVLLYVTAVLGFRLAARRTLAEMNAFDFIAAVAVGAIVGRVANADGTGYLGGWPPWSRCWPATPSSPSCVDYLASPS